MKKLMSIAAALLMAFSLAKPAQAECDGLYVALRGGMASHDIDATGYFIGGNADGLDKEKLMLSGALGYRYEWFRTELEFVWRDHIKNATYEGDEKTSDVKFKTYSYMWNFYWDILPYHWLSPYINVGIGLTKIKYYSVDPASGIDRFQADATRFTMAAGGGFTIKLTNRWNVDLGYRYYDMGKLKSADITAQEFYAGVRYVF